MVVHGWSQGTLEAFGVGLIVGGLVDVLALSRLNQMMQEENNEGRLSREGRP
jgi:hypothetical protein